jgi:HSP20 family protein
MSDIRSLHRGIDRLFDDMFEMAPQQMDFNPAVDIEEQDEHYLMSMDLPGVSKDNVHIEVNDNQLMVWGERKEEREEEKKNRYFVERSYGRFQRTFALPTHIDPDRIEADFKDGVLRIAVPKSQTAQARTVKIGEQKTGGLLTRLFGKQGQEQQQQQGAKKAAS